MYDKKLKESELHSYRFLNPFWRGNLWHPSTCSLKLHMSCSIRPPAANPTIKSYIQRLRCKTFQRK
jgi:hypothetical protein